MSHANARFTPAGRLLIVERIEAGMPQAHVARQMGLSRGTVAKWWHRWLEEGEAGLVDRSSRPRRCPRRTDARLEERVCRLRRSTRREPVYLGARTGLPASTVWRILKRNGLNRLSWIDRPTGRVIHRYERSAPGELMHLDIKKVGKIPPGGGWRVHGRGSDRAKRANRSKRRPVGYTHLHVAIDDYSRVAYVEAHDNETTATLVGFWRRAQGWFWSNDMAVDEVLTDNGPNFVSDAFAELLAERRILHRRTRPYRVGAGNSAVVVDLPRCGPMLSPRVPNLVPILGITRSAHRMVRPLEGPRDRRVAPPLAVLRRHRRGHVCGCRASLFRHRSDPLQRFRRLNLSLVMESGEDLKYVHTIIKRLSHS